jgi:hypothetical protein
MRDPEEYVIAGTDPDTAAAEVLWRVCRTTLDSPGFAVLDLGPTSNPRDFRSLLVRLCAALGRVYGEGFGQLLLLRSVDRFDQQVTTEFHLDGGPEESVLVLGYEPTAVASRLFLADYTQAALNRGVTPQEFLARFNPAVGQGREELKGYTTEVAGLHQQHYRVVVINNSSLPLEGCDRGMLGVLHRAVIVNPRPDEARVVNSIALTTAEAGAAPLLTAEQVETFIENGASAVG